MPIYVYKFVDTGETIEVEQSFTDDTLTEYPHPDDGTPMAVKKVFQPVGVTFKGSGFYKTDSRSSKSASKTGGSAAGAESPAKESKKETSPSGAGSGSSGSGSSGSGSSGAGSSSASSSAKSDG